MSEITIGRIVFYTLDEQDAEQINRRRTSGQSITARFAEEPNAWPNGAQAHVGNEVSPGDVFPLIVTRVWSLGCVNGQVLLDGNDCFWATSVTEGQGRHMWAWPIKQEAAAKAAP